jgi:predicted ester cyclase
MSAANKFTVQRFNLEVIEGRSREVFEELVSEDFVNHTAASGVPEGREGLWSTFDKVLHPAISNLKVTILDQVSEGQKVTTRKRISGLHSGELLGLPGTGRSISIDVIDIVVIRDGRYAAHWGINTLGAVLNALRQG